MAGPSTAHSAYKDMKNLIDSAYKGPTKSTLVTDQPSQLTGKSDQDFSASFMSYLKQTSDIMRAGETASAQAAAGHITHDVTFAVSNMKQKVEELSTLLREMRDAINRITSMNP